MKERKREKEEERKQGRTCVVGKELKMRRRSYIVGLCHSPACLGLKLVSISEQGLSTVTWGLESRSWEATAIVCYKQTA